MPEDKKQRQKIKYYRKEYTCDKCGKGKMERAHDSWYHGAYSTNDDGTATYTMWGIYSNNNGTHYPHVCTACGHRTYFTNISYPHEYEKRIVIK